MPARRKNEPTDDPRELLQAALALIKRAMVALGGEPLEPATRSHAVLPTRHVPIHSRHTEVMAPTVSPVWIVGPDVAQASAGPFPTLQDALDFSGDRAGYVLWRHNSDGSTQILYRWDGEAWLKK